MGKHGVENCTTFLLASKLPKNYSVRILIKVQV